MRRGKPHVSLRWIRIFPARAGTATRCLLGVPRMQVQTRGPKRRKIKQENKIKYIVKKKTKKQAENGLAHPPPHHPFDVYQVRCTFSSPSQMRIVYHIHNSLTPCRFSKGAPRHTLPPHPPGSPLHLFSIVHYVQRTPYFVQLLSNKGPGILACTYNVHTCVVVRQYVRSSRLGSHLAALQRLRNDHQRMRPVMDDRDQVLGLD